MNFAKSLELLSKLLISVANEKQMNWLLKDLMTPQEIEELSERIRIFQSLQTWKTQRKIAEDLCISVTTVNRGARAMKYGSGEINKII